MRWLRRLFRKSRAERELDQELRFHLERQIADNLAAGMTPQEARRQSLLTLGGMERVKQEVRDAHWETHLENLFQDTRYALRTLAKSPGFTAVTVITLALGIGSNTAVFSVANAVLLKPLNAPDPDRVVLFMNTNRYGSAPVAADIEFNLLREQTTVVEGVSGFRSGTYYLTGVDQAVKVDAMLVTEDYFRLFGLPIAKGHGFTPTDERGTGRLFEDGHVAVLSNAFWKRRFSADAHILGKVISLSGNPYEIVGIMAASVRTEAPEQPDVWLPFPMSPNSNNQTHYFEAAGRLMPGVTLATANSQLKLMTEEFRREYPDTVSAKRGDTYSVEPMQDTIVKNVRLSLLALVVAVGLVLFIACANAANLLLARATSRRREIAIRAALGATRARIVRQLLAESILLSIGAGLLGVAAGLAGIRSVVPLIPSTVPRIGLNGSNVTMDWRVLLFTSVVTLITGILFGLIPGLSASRTDPNWNLTQGYGRTGMGLTQTKTRSSLVIVEMSLTLVLLIASALFIRTLVALRSVEPGFDAKNVFVTQTPLDPKLLKSSELNEVIENAISRLDDLPGVQKAALTTVLPLAGDFNRVPIAIVGQEPDSTSQGFAMQVFVSPDYFAALKVPLLRGHPFTDADGADAPPVAIVNQTMARQLWPDGDPIGTQIIVGKGLGTSLEQPPSQIIGVVGDVHSDSLGLPPQPAVFMPAAQRGKDRWTRVTVAWVVRARTQSPSVTAEIQNLLRQTTGLPIGPLKSMQQVIEKSTDSQSFSMVLMSIFGGSALLLAAIGIYGVMAYLVVQRTGEIGIRMALGAQRTDILKMVLGGGTKLALAGIVVGIAAGFGLTRLLTSMLFGVRPADPLTFLLVPVGLLTVALTACYIPARRAARVDPMVALRYE